MFDIKELTNKPSDVILEAAQEIGRKAIQVHCDLYAASLISDRAPTKIWEEKLEEYEQVLFEIGYELREKDPATKDKIDAIRSVI